MSNAMLKFVTVGQTMPRKRSADARRDDFGEIYDAFAEAESGHMGFFIAWRTHDHGIGCPLNPYG